MKRKQRVVLEARLVGQGVLQRAAAEYRLPEGEGEEIQTLIVRNRCRKAGEEVSLRAFSREYGWPGSVY